MKFALFVASLTLTTISTAQNLVPNPSFEDTLSCPSENGDGVENATGWLNCGNSPDYYHSCANSSMVPEVGVPEGLYVGFQEPRTGNAYCGLSTYSNPDTGREFIGCQLSEPLSVGLKYFISLHIARSNIYDCATNNFGVKFFNSMSFGSTTPPSVDNIAHLNFSSIVNDTSSWLKLSGSFTADASYEYMVLGNFFDNSMTDTMNCDPISNNYYVIDEVCVSSDSVECTQLTNIYSFNFIEIEVRYDPLNELLTIVNLPNRSLVRLVDTHGRQIFSELTDLDHLSICTNQLRPGIYLIHIDNSFSQKILINP